MKHFTRTLLYMLTLLLSAIAMPADAQQRQDALYIFRNDGQFNAFFYGDIQHICYSKIDTLGVEHDDFVTQEVWALDTIYRIPVSAIDSVSFVTPETKVKADVFCPDKSIADYIIASDSVWWIRLAPNTPQELIPQVGQKLLIAEASQYIPNGFGGKVAYSELQSEGWLIITEEVELSDIYERLLLKAAAATPGASTTARRRGLIDGTELSVVNEVPFELGSYDNEFTLKNSHQLTPDSSPIAVTADLTGDVKTNFNAYMNSFRAFVFYDVQYGLKADIKTTMSYAGKIELELSGGLTGRLEAGYPVEKNVEGVKVKLGLGIYAEGSFSGFKFSWEKDLGGFVDTFMAIDEKDPFTPKLIPSSIPTFHYHVAPNNSEGSTSFEVMNQASFGAGLFAKAEIEAAIPLKKGKITDFVKGYLNKYVENDTLKFLNFEFGVDIGGKIEFKFPTSLLAELGISLGAMIDKFEPKFPTLMDTQDIYSKLDKETGVKVSAADKIGGSMKMGKYWSFEWPIINEDVESSSHGLVPTVDHVSVGPDEDDQPVKPWIHKITAGIRRNLILPGVKIGFVVTDRDNNDEIVTKNSSLNYHTEAIFEHNLMHFKNNTYNLTFDDIDPKKGEPANYTAYPLVVWLGGELLGDTKKEFTLDPANFDIEDREPVLFAFDYEDNEYPLEVKPNMKKVEIEPKAKWLKEPYHDYRNNKLLVRWEALPDSVEEIKGTILLKGLSSKTDEVLVEDSVVVTLVRGILELSSDSLIFDLKGGVGSIEITRTNLKDFQVLIDANEKWLRGSVQDDKYITITVDESDEEYRASFVRVRGYTPKGKYVERAFWVRQHPAEGIPTVSPNNMIFFLEGGKQTAIFNKANYPYSGVFVSDEGKKWAHAELDSKGVVTVTVDATSDEQGRSCTVVCWASNKPNPMESEMVQLPITVNQQKPATFKVMEVDIWSSALGKYTEYDPVNKRDKEYRDRNGASHNFIAYGEDKNAEITYFESGNDLYVECRGDYRMLEITYTATLSFTVENWKNQSKVKVTNVNFNQSPISYSSWWTETRGEVTNIPVVEYVTDYPDPFNLPERLPIGIDAKGTIADGVVFNNWYHKNKEHNYDYVSSPDNFVDIYIDINPWGDLVNYEDWDDDDDWDDEDWGDYEWARSTDRRAGSNRNSSTSERRVLQRLQKAGKR